MDNSSSPLKTSENYTVFCFQGLERGCIGNEWVNANVSLSFTGKEICSTNIFTTFIKTSPSHNGFSEFFIHECYT